jgi:hypothetical protein
MQDTVAGIGDVVQARKNDWSWRRVIGKAVVNREMYRVTGTGTDGSLQVRQLSRGENNAEKLGPEIRLKARYVERHVTLGYAVTVHSAQGATVDTATGIYSDQTSLEALYVALTRARERNVGIAVTRTIDDGAPLVPEGVNAPQPGEDRATPLQVAAGIAERAEPDRSALQTERESLLSSISLRTLAARHTEVTELANAQRYAGVVDRLVAEGTLPAEVRDRLLAGGAEVDGLWRLVRSGELAGHEPGQLLGQAARGRSLDDAGSVAKVLYHRIANRHTGQLIPTGDTYAERTPTDAPGDFGRYLRASAQAMDTRRGALGEQVAADPPQWALRRLGPVPEEVVERAEWTHRAGLVAAYREQAGYDDDRDAIGPAPRPGQTEQRAAWHAAWRAFGAPEEEREYASMTGDELRERVEAYQRATAWSPPWVGDELRATAEAARTYRQEVQLHTARAAAVDDVDEAAELADTAAAYASLAGQLEEQHQRLLGIDDARAEWYLHTAAERAAADQAGRELALREAVEVEPTTRASDLVGTDRSEVLDQLVERGTLSDRQRELLEADVVAPALWRLVDVAERDGHDVQQVLTEAVEQRDLGDAESVAAVLHYRVTHTIEQRTPEHVETDQVHVDQADAAHAAEQKPEQVEAQRDANATAREAAERVVKVDDAGADAAAEHVDQAADTKSAATTVKWPDNVPTLDQTIEAAQKAREALQAIEAQRAEAQAREAHEAQERADAEARERTDREEYDRERARELEDEGRSLGL